MNDITRRVLGLLAELDGFCKNAQITYFCAGVLPRIVVENEFYDFDSARVFIMAQDLPVLYKALTRSRPVKKKQRLIEYCGNNSDYPTYSLHYADASTTVWSGNRVYPWRYGCAYVEIIPLQSRKELAPELDLMQQMPRMNNPGYCRKLMRDRSEEEQASLERMFVNYRGFSERKRRRQMFQVLEASRVSESAKSARCYLYLDGKLDHLTVREPLLTELRSYRIAGQEVPMPEDIHGWYEKLYPVKKGERRFPVYRNQYTVASADIPFERFESFLREEKVLSEELMETRRSLAEHRRAADRYRPRIEAVWDLALELYGEKEPEDRI